LDDDKSARMVPVDRDLTRWQEATLVRRAAMAAAGRTQGKIPVAIGQGGIVWDAPTVALAVGEVTEVMYIAPAGQKVAKLGYKGTRTTAFINFEAATLYTDDNEALSSATGVAITLDDTVREVTPTPDRYAMLRVDVTTAHTPAGAVQQRFDKLAVYDGSVTTRAISGDLDGVYASDVVTYAVQKWAPMLTTMIQPSSFVIPHLAFLEPTTCGEIVRQASRFDLPDWGVWENKTFWWTERGANSRFWRARIAPSELEETGPQVDRLWESIVVQYQDVDGSTRTVGPPGSGADTESSDLKDSDPENAANKLGIVRRDLLQMGVSTAAGATEVGRRFLLESRQLDRSGKARAVGYVEDDRGVLHPYHHLRAGDYVAFPDASDKSYRRVVRTEKDYDARTVTFDLDAPPEGLAALLERLGVVLVPLGIGS